ncbi:hypothetical protein BC831DRAFT_176692 [Entophlyctis helioformis]|nr:hypothetical protein BC831DRAFT_176692 [Entophlyctis helioformis]
MAPCGHHQRDGRVRHRSGPRHSATKRKARSSRLCSSRHSCLTHSTTKTAGDTILENIRSANVFVVIILSAAEHVVGLMPAIRAKGMMSSKYAWIGSDGMIGAIRQAPGLTVIFPSEGNGPAFAKFNELWDQHKMDINTTDKQNSPYSTKFVSCLGALLARVRPVPAGDTRCNTATSGCRRVQPQLHIASNHVQLSRTVLASREDPAGSNNWRR